VKNDYEIWERFKAGDKSALSYVYFQYFHSMFQYGIKFKDDPDFVKDCIQDVFIKLIKAGEKLGATENIRYYLFKALKNVLYKNMMKDRKTGFVTLEFDVPYALEEEISEKENASEREKALANALSQLSPRQREIIYLRFECGMDYNHICEIMQMKSDSARKLVFRSIKSLKEIIEGYRTTPVLFFFSFPQKHVF